MKKLLKNLDVNNLCLLYAMAWYFEPGDNVTLSGNNFEVTLYDPTATDSEPYTTKRYTKTKLIDDLIERLNDPDVKERLIDDLNSDYGTKLSDPIQEVIECIEMQNFDNLPNDIIIINGKQLNPVEVLIVKESLNHVYDFGSTYNEHIEEKYNVSEEKQDSVTDTLTDYFI